MKCSNCGCEFEGNFCPNCGTVAGEVTRCPVCGKERTNNERFCSGCGYAFEKHEQKKETADPVTLYKILTYSPIALFAVMAVLAFLFSIAPAVSGWFSVSAYGLLGDDSVDGMQGTAIILLIAELMFFVAAAAFAYLLYRFKSTGDNRLLKVLKYGVLVSAAYYLILFIIGIVMCAQVSAFDGGFGAFSAGACPILFIVFSILFGIAEAAAVVLKIQLVKKYPQLAEVDFIQNSGAAIKKERKPLSRKAKKRIIFNSVLLAVVIITIIVIVVIVNNISNIFRVGKVSQINLGDSKSQVVEILGEPDEYTETTYTYYSENYNKILKEIENLDADNIDDWDDMIEATAQKAKLYTELISITYQRIDVTFYDGEVTSIYLDASCCDSTVGEKTLKGVTVLSGTFEQYSTDTTVEITYEAKFTDGSYAKATATATRDSSEMITTTSNGIEITWSDKLYNQYSDTISISENDTTYYIDGNTLYVFTSDAFKTLTSSKLSSITDVILYDGVTSIGDSAFSKCTSIKSVTIGNGVTSIGDSAFSNCTSLKSVTMGNRVTSIDRNAFYFCTSLTSITIPDSVTSIGEYAFYYCSSLSSITIPDSVTSIGGAAFRNCTSLKNVTIPDSVIYIDYSAFEDCTALTSLNIPNSVTFIGSSAFYNCTSLLIVYYSGTASEWASISFGDYYANPLYYTGNLYLNGTLATNITIENITEINSYAFYNCTSLTKVTIGNVVTSIGSYAFCRCSSLTSINIGDSITSISEYTFRGCTKLTSVTFKNTSGWYVSKKSGATSGTDISSSELSNTSTAAEYLTDSYNSYYWYRSED